MEEVSLAYPSHVCGDVSSEAVDWLPGAVSDGNPRTWSSYIPAGFAAYARVFHPPYGRGPEATGLLRWGDIAAAAGLELTPFTRWEDIAPESSPLQKPLLGSSPPEVLGPVLRVALRYAGPAPDALCLAWWAGFGPPAAPCPELGRTLKLPGREYTVCGLLVDDLDLLLAARRSPSILWPTSTGRPDWVVVVEVDDRSTVVAGDAVLVDRILGSGNLESAALDHASARFHSP